MRVVHVVALYYRVITTTSQFMLILLDGIRTTVVVPQNGELWGAADCAGTSTLDAADAP